MQAAKDYDEMKNHFNGIQEKALISILFFVTSIAGYSQLEFAPIGAEWYYSQFVGFDPPQGANYIKHACFKDSAIDGKLVKVIQKTKFTREGQFELGFEYLHQNADTISYWKNGKFHELYNFSLEKGDSMLIYSDTSNYMPCDTSHYGWINIDSVFSVAINNQKLKGYFASHKEGSYWGFGSRPIIEKIGSTSYLLPHDEGCIMDMPGIGPLRCYSDPEFGIYYNGNEPCDTLTTFPVYAPVINNNHQFNLYPNPVTDYLTIGYSGSDNFDAEIYNSYGNLVLRQEFCPGDRINMSGLTVGIYFTTISKNNKYYYDGVIFKK